MSRHTGVLMRNCCNAVRTMSRPRLQGVAGTLECSCESAASPSGRRLGHDCKVSPAHRRAHTNLLHRRQDDVPITTTRRRRHASGLALLCCTAADILLCLVAADTMSRCQQPEGTCKPNLLHRCQDCAPVPTARPRRQSAGTPVLLRLCQDDVAILRRRRHTDALMPCCCAAAKTTPRPHLPLPKPVAVRRDRRIGQADGRRAGQGQTKGRAG